MNLHTPMMTAESEANIHASNAGAYHWLSDY